MWLFALQRLFARVDVVVSPFAVTFGTCAPFADRAYSYLIADPAACYMQGNTQEELPEVALGGVRINALDLLAAQPLDLSAPAQRLESPLKEDSPNKRR